MHMNTTQLSACRHSGKHDAGTCENMRLTMLAVDSSPGLTDIDPGDFDAH